MSPRSLSPRSLSQRSLSPRSLSPKSSRSPRSLSSKRNLLTIVLQALFKLRMSISPPFHSPVNLLSVTALNRFALAIITVALDSKWLTEKGLPTENVRTQRKRATNSHPKPVRWMSCTTEVLVKVTMVNCTSQEFGFTKAVNQIGSGPPSHVITIMIDQVQVLSNGYPLILLRMNTFSVLSITILNQKVTIICTTSALLSPSQNEVKKPNIKNKEFDNFCDIKTIL